MGAVTRYEIGWTVTTRHRVKLTEGEIREIFAVPDGTPIDRAVLVPHDALAGVEGDYNTNAHTEGRELVALRDVTATTSTAATVPIGTVLESGAEVTGREVEAGGYVSIDFRLCGVDFVEVHGADAVFTVAGAR